MVGDARIRDKRKHLDIIIFDHKSRLSPSLNLEDGHESPIKLTYCLWSRIHADTT